MLRVVAVCMWCGVVLAGAGCRGEAGKPAKAQSEVPAVTVAEPSDGSTTSARSIVLTGTAATSSPGRSALVWISVNGRPTHVDLGTREATEPARPESRYRVPLALEVGANEIVVRRDTYREYGDRPDQSSSPLVVRVTRQPSPGDDTGVLDLATAHLASGFGEDRYWVCGEGHCDSDTRCFALGPRRVDCPVFNYSPGDDLVRRCALVATVRLRGKRIYHDTYPCEGRMRPDARRFVRPGFWSKGDRLRIGSDEPDEDEWFHAAMNAPNRYGAPRFDIDRDVFLP